MALTTVRPEGIGFNTGRRNLVINGAMQVSQRGPKPCGTKWHWRIIMVDRFKTPHNGSIAIYTVNNQSMPIVDLQIVTKIAITTVTSAAVTECWFFRSDLKEKT